MTRKEKLAKIEKLIEDNIEVHSRCSYCGDELFGETDSYDVEQAAFALLALFEDGVLIDRDGMVAKIKTLIKNNNEFFDPTDPDLNRMGLALLALFEDGVLMNRDGMVAKIKTLIKNNIDLFTYCEPCNEDYESQIEGHPIWSDDKSILKTAEALFDLLLELKHA